MIMKRSTLTIIIPFIFLNILYSQSIYLTYNGIATFTSDAPLEMITASSDQVQGAVDLSDRSFLFSIENKSFKGFNSSLQQEHFYENYMEVRKYPKSTFNGKIIEELDLSSIQEQVVRAKGILNIHGAEQERIIKGTLRITGEKLVLHADFTVPLEDHNIKIPKVVNQKIAEIINVSFSAEMTLKKD
jgi:hypothetical protein